MAKWAEKPKANSRWNHGEPTDWLRFTAAAAILGSIAFLACLVPARKATRIDPATTLRTP